MKRSLFLVLNLIIINTTSLAENAKPDLMQLFTLDDEMKAKIESLQGSSDNIITPSLYLDPVDIKKIDTSDLKLKQLLKDKKLIENLTLLRQLPNGQFLSTDDGGFSSGGGGNAVVCYKKSGLISEISLLDYVEGLRKDQSLEKRLDLHGNGVYEKLEYAFDKMMRRYPYLGKELKSRALLLEREMEKNLLPAN